jgi:NADPH:quinone reductase-like Zn-dependent oxidoreductase
VARFVEEVRIDVERRAHARVAENPADLDDVEVQVDDPDQLSSLARLVDRGELLPGPVEVFPLMSAREAFARSLEPDRRGKVALAIA